MAETLVEARDEIEMVCKQEPFFTDDLDPLEEDLFEISNSQSMRFTPEQGHSSLEVLLEGLEREIPPLIAAPDGSFLSMASPLNDPPDELILSSSAFAKLKKGKASERMDRQKLRPERVSNRRTIVWSPSLR